MPELPSPSFRRDSATTGSAFTARAARLAQGPAPARGGSTGGRLPQGRERRRDQQLVFLPDRPHPGLWRPLATLPRFLPDAVSLVGVLVDPDVHELVQPAELAGPAGGQRRDLLTGGNSLAPGLQHRREGARGGGVDPHLV